MSCLSYTGRGEEKKKAWPRSTTTNTRASQLIKIDGAGIVNYLFIYLF
jgi:hypothetical protein